MLIARNCFNIYDKEYFVVKKTKYYKEKLGERTFLKIKNFKI